MKKAKKKIQIHDHDCADLDQERRLALVVNRLVLVGFDMNKEIGYAYDPHQGVSVFTQQA